MVGVLNVPRPSNVVSSSLRADFIYISDLSVEVELKLKLSTQELNDP